MGIQVPGTPEVSSWLVRFHLTGYSFLPGQWAAQQGPSQPTQTASLGMGGGWAAAPVAYTGSMGSEGLIWEGPRRISVTPGHINSACLGAPGLSRVTVVSGMEKEAGIFRTPVER